MEVICQFNKGSDLPSNCLDPIGGYNKDTSFSLEINKSYIVYAITIHLGYPWYYICDEDYLYYPVWNPSPLFNISNGNLSKYWIFAFYSNKEKNNSTSIWAFPNWAIDPHTFYNNLTDNQIKEVTIFKKYKNLMDLEFARTEIKDKAIILQNNWVMCPFCQESWEIINSRVAMTKCPKCNKILHSPLYVDLFLL